MKIHLYCRVGKQLLLLILNKNPFMFNLVFYWDKSKIDNTTLFNLEFINLPLMIKLHLLRTKSQDTPPTPQSCGNTKLRGPIFYGPKSHKQ